MSTDACGEARDKAPENTTEDRAEDGFAGGRAAARRAFVVACLVLVTTLLVAGSLLLTVGTVPARPEGVAERWLTYAGESTRAGVGLQARAHADAIGPVALAASMLDIGTGGGEAAFATVTVGSADVYGDLARVPFHVRQRRDDVPEPDVHGTLSLRRTGDDWRVTGLDRGAGVAPAQPSRRTRPWLFPGALLLAVAVAATCSLLVRVATPSTGRRDGARG
ncbi:hypothetical protein ABZ801_09880 [Actinomadura sp. NPDC047616]|uniref:hypothetical protein n=1 Tax=Actinomadura sp. NPDC047616 TaxID=3155914 RepID=UPI0033FABE82